MSCARFIFVLLLSLMGATFTRSSTPPAPSRSGVDAEYRQQLHELVDQLRQEGQADAASSVADWILPELSDRQRLFLSFQSPTQLNGNPDLDDQEAANGDEAQATWQREFDEIRKRHAQALWGYAREAAQQGDLETAVQTVHEVYREQPQDPQAEKFLRWHLIDPDAIRSKRVRTPQREFGWAGGAHFLITTPHFLIQTNSEPDGRQLAELLEETYQVWSQVFVRHWTDAATLRRAFEGRSLPAASRKRHRVVLFADREQYINYLKRWEPQIELSNGVYRPSDQTAYFYAGPGVEKYWRHELVHQLLAETGTVRPAKRAEPPGTHAHAWLVEGIAVYFESARRETDAILLGGFESARLQFARYRLLQEGFYLPSLELMSLGREALKQHAQIRKIYTQSAGLVHYLMDGDQGSHRSVLIEIVRQLYQEPKAIQDFDFIGSIERNYRSFLMVDDALFSQLQFPQQITELCLGRTEVTDEISGKVASLTGIEWLDLAGCDIGDEVVKSIPSTAPLRQLSLRGTRITHEALPHLTQFEGLEELDLSDCNLPESAIEKLQSELPNLRP